MSDIRKYINVLTESEREGTLWHPDVEDRSGESVQRFKDEIEEYVEDQMSMGTDETAIIDAVRELHGEDGATLAQDYMDHIEGSWVKSPLAPYDEAVDEDSIYQGADEYADSVEPCCSGSDGDTPDEKFGDDEIYEEEVDEEWTPPLESGEECEDPVSDEWWENQFNETLERMKHLAGVEVVAEEDENVEEVDEDKEEEPLEEDSIYQGADEMNTEKKWDEMGNDSAGPNEKFGDDEIYDGEAGPLAHKKHTDRPGEHNAACASFSKKMAEACVAGKDIFEHKGQTFKVRMNEARAKDILK